MPQIKVKLSYVPTLEYYCDNCGRKLGSNEIRDDMNVSKGKLYLYRWYKGRCPGCKSRLTKPEVDDYVIADMKATLYGKLGGRDAGSC